MDSLCDDRQHPRGLIEFFVKRRPWSVCKKISGKIKSDLLSDIAQTDSPCGLLDGPFLKCVWTCHRHGQYAGKMANKTRVAMSGTRVVPPSKKCGCPGKIECKVFLESRMAVFKGWHQHNHPLDVNQWAMATCRIERRRDLCWMVQDRMSKGASNWEIKKHLTLLNFSLDARLTDYASKLFRDEHILSITMDDIRNFRNKMGFSDSPRHRNDLMSTKLLFKEWVARLEDHCPIVYLKFSGESPDEAYSCILGSDLHKKITIPKGHFCKVRKDLKQPKTIVMEAHTL